jgi:hypothetical protein
MFLTDEQINFFDRNVLKLKPERRQAYLEQVDYLITRLKTKVDEDSAFAVRRFTKTGSLMKGTVLRPRGDAGVDADIAVDLDVAEADKDDVDLLHSILRELLMAVYPTKKPGDFQVQPYTLGIQFHDSGLAVDLVPVIPIPEEPGFGWQPSSRGRALVKTSVSGQLTFIKARRDADRRYRGLVRLAKQWRNQHELPLRSFAIELLLAHLLDQEGAAQSLEDGLLRFFLFVAQTELREPISFPENGVVLSYPSDPVVVLDPVNADNNVTKRITEAERQEIVAAAIDAWERLTTGRRNGYIGETSECWKDVFGRSFVVEE